MADLAGGATGMLFDYAAASSYFPINSNTINLLAGDTLTHRGIIFT
jgi:hypothetical protein